MLAHAMSAGLLPAGVVAAIDKRRRAFLWTGDDSCTGGQCKNSALLAKFLTKIHSNTDAPWACWFRRRYGWSDTRDLGDPHSLDTPIWKDIVAGLSFFRSISIVNIGDGSSTASGSTIGLGTPLLVNATQLSSHTLPSDTSLFRRLSSKGWKTPSSRVSPMRLRQT
uniref:Uncharacterized protein n=1 Tax=Avena sativa TaxID=4498 RepID=A0ACD5YLB1_AVESA